tara:strand:- start:4778 stop:4981 length:204 start_codon:yes stop_codon:yes gene_type:complete
MAKCVGCFNEYSEQRKQLGYLTCLSCGEKDARHDTIMKSKRVAPAFNKGGYQYIHSTNELTSIGRKL